MATTTPQKTDVSLPPEKKDGKDEKEKPKDKPEKKPEGKKEEKEKKGKVVKVTMPSKNPFVKAQAKHARLKLFLWGETGSGKTRLALHFPSPTVIDQEKGTIHYAAEFDFHVKHTTDPNVTIEAVDWLRLNKHPYKTLIIDPITLYWEALQKKWSEILLRRNVESKGYKHEFYDMQVKDWMAVKGEWKEFIRKLLGLDMNVIVTAREKTKYKDGGFMQAIGETFDGEKSLPYLFDTVMRLFKTKEGKYMGLCIKDRTGKFPEKGEFEISYKMFEKRYGAALKKEAIVISYASPEQIQKIKDMGNELGMTAEKIQSRLSAYDAESWDELTEDNAKIIIEKLETAKTKKENENG